MKFLREKIVHFSAAIKSGIKFCALGVPRPVTGFQPATAE